MSFPSRLDLDVHTWAEVRKGSSCIGAGLGDLLDVANLSLQQSLGKSLSLLT